MAKFQNEEVVIVKRDGKEQKSKIMLLMFMKD